MLPLPENSLSTSGQLWCPTSLRNNGNVPIRNVTVQGDSNNCTWPYSQPGETMQCTVWRNIDSVDLNNDTFTVVAGLSGMPVGPKSLLPVSTSKVVVANPSKQVAVVTVVVSASTGFVSALKEAVAYTMTLVSI